MSRLPRALAPDDPVHPSILTPEACVAARRALGWSMVRLSAYSGVSTTTVAKVEAHGSVQVVLLWAIRAAFEDAGLRFSGQDGACVRMARCPAP